MKRFHHTPTLARAAAFAALAAAVLSGAPTAASAAMTKQQVADKIAKEFNVKVLRVEPRTEFGKPIYAVTVMNGGGNWNHAFQVNTLAVDANTGKLVIQYRQQGGQLREGAPPVQDRTAPMTAENR